MNKKWAFALFLILFLIILGILSWDDVMGVINPTPTSTITPTSKPTNTPTNISTSTPTNTPTNTLTSTPTNTPSPTPTDTSTPTNTPIPFVPTNTKKPGGGDGGNKCQPPQVWVDCPEPIPDGCFHPAKACQINP